MKVYSPKVVSELLEKYGLSPSKQFSQNFLIDENTLLKISDAAKGHKNIVEIGPGLGALTRFLSDNAEKVLCYEIDRGMATVLKETLQDKDNVTVINEDAMKADFKGDTRRLFGNESFFVAANLPYAITSPIIMRFLEEDLPVDGMVLMMQTEVAQRICAADGEDKSAFTLAVSFYSDAKQLFKVPPSCFYPKPNVYSTVVKFDTKNRDFAFKKQFFMLTKALFAMKRKTAENNFSKAFGVSKQRASEFFKELNLDPAFRAQQFTTDDFLKMSEYLDTFLKG